MNKDYKKYLPILTRVIIAVIVIFGIYIFSTTVLIYLLPFIIGWIIASIVQPLIYFLTVRLKFPRNLSAFIAITLFVLLTGFMISLVGSIIILQLIRLSNMLPEYSQKLYHQSSYLVKQVQDLFIQLPPDIAQSIVNGLNILSNKLIALLGMFVTSLLSFITAIPSFFLFIIVAIISAYFMARDKRKILRFIIAQLPAKTLSKGRIIKNDLFLALTGYIKAQLILMSITFIESAVGLTLIGIDYSILIAFVASIIDAFPILGTGFIYVPLIFWKLLTRHYQTALLLGILYGIILFIRQLLEPKILSNQIGLYPLVTLMAMYFGLKLFGIVGLIIGPISIIVLMTLQKIGIFPNWKK